MDDRLYLFIVYGSYFISTVVLSFLINGLFLKFASTLGIRNSSETFIRWSPQVKPSLGGISFFLLFLFWFFFFRLLFRRNVILHFLCISFLILLSHFLVFFNFLRIFLCNFPSSSKFTKNILRI